MAYNNYNNNNRGGYGRGYNDRGGYGRGYNDRGGYSRGYDDRGGYEPAPVLPPIPFEIGQIVRHRATNQELSVIRIGREQVECRLPDLSSQWFYVHELDAVEGK